jgi:hypothetical protein
MWLWAEMPGEFDEAKDPSFPGQTREQPLNAIHTSNFAIVLREIRAQGFPVYSFRLMS